MTANIQENEAVRIVEKLTKFDYVYESREKRYHRNCWDAAEVVVFDTGTARTN